MRDSELNRRLPHEVYFGPGFLIRVILCSRAEMKEAAEDDEDTSDGLWLFEPVDQYCGTIAIYNRLPLTEKWSVYRHELIHALNDLEAWNREHPLAT